MWDSTCIPSKVDHVLYPLKRPFRCAQAHHVLVFWWLLMALSRDPGQCLLKGLMSYLPPSLTDWTTMRLSRSGQWDAAAVVERMATTTLRTLPPPADGVLSLSGDSTVQDKRGRPHPWGHTTRHSEHDSYTFGFEMVLLIARWDRVRVPIALAPIDPPIKGHQHLLLRQRLKDCVCPAWGRQVIGVAAAGCAANETWRRLTQ